MDEDRLIRELADLAREGDEAGGLHLDERWDRLAARTLTAEEEAELRALAAASPEAREAYEAFRPLDTAFQDRVVAALAAETRTAPSSRILPFRRGIARLGASLAAAAAVAAGLLIVLRGPSSQPAPIPAYTVELSGGAQTSRGEAGPTSGPQVFVPGELMTITAQPERSVGPVEARGFFVRGGEIVPWKPQPETNRATGSVRFRGTLGTDIRLPPGDWKAWIVVGRPGRIPPMDDLMTELGAGKIRNEYWRAASMDLRVEESPP